MEMESAAASNNSEPILQPNKAVKVKAEKNPKTTENIHDLIH